MLRLLKQSTPRQFALLCGLLLTLLLGAVWPVMAQPSPQVTVTPDSGAIGDAFVVTVEGLQPSTEYTLEFIYQPDNSVVFNTRRFANDNGQLTLEVISEPTDLPGDYIVNVLANNRIVASGQLTLIEEEATPEQGEQPPGAGQIDVRIIPRSAVQGSNYNILVSGLDPLQVVTVTIVEDATGEEFYNRRVTATDTGRFDLEIFSTDDNSPGSYTFSVLDDAGNLLGDITFNVEEPPGRNGEIALSPPTANPGEPQTLTLSNVRPFADFTVRITNPDNREVLVEGTIRANAEGVATWEFTTPADASEGIYEIVVNEIESRATVASSQLIVGDVEQPAPEIVITPAEAPRGTDFDVSISGLLPNSSFTFEIILQATGETVYSVERQADASGQFETTLGTNDTDDTGEYAIVVRQNDNELGRSVLVLTDEGGAAQVPEAQVSPGDVTLDLSPAQPQPGSTLFISATGLESGERVTVTVASGDNVLAEREINADINGSVVLSVPTSDDIAPGEYTVTVERDDTTLATRSFNLGDVATTPAQPQQPTGDVTIDIAPTGGPIGTTYAIGIIGLNANETVTVAISYQGEVVFETQATADENGAARLSVVSEEGDPAGEYEVSVLRDEVELASAPFAIDEEPTTVEPQQPPTEPEVVEPEPFDGSITITPESAPRESTYDVVIEGLTPGETITLNVTLDGEVVYTTEKTADDEGRVSLILASSEEDPAGVYTVEIVRTADDADQVIASADFVVEQPDMTEPQQPPAEEPEEVIIRIDPQSGPIGTSHAVIISGLQPGETVTLDVLYAGSVDFSTERTADNLGQVAINLIASEGDPFGTYTVQVKRGDELVAEAELIVQTEDAPETPETVEIPAGQREVFEGELTFTAPEFVTSFAGNEGELVFITLASPDFDAYLLLEDDLGNVLTTNDDDGTTLNSAIGPYILPYTGTYTVVATSYDYENFVEPSAGSYTLTIERASLTPVEYNTPTVLTFDDATTGQFLSIDAAVGDTLSIVVESDGEIDTQLSVTDPFNVVIIQDDDSGAGFDPEVERLVIQNEGTYILSVRPFSAGEEGSVVVEVERDTARMLEPGTTATLRLNEKQSLDLVRITGNAGETVRFTVSTRSGDTGFLFIRAMQGDTELMRYEAMQVPESFDLSFVSQSDENISIIVEGAGSRVLELSRE